MGKLNDLLETYNADNKKLGLGLKSDLIEKVARGLGPSIYRADASTVSASDKSELERVKKSYLIKKLGLKDTPKLDEAIKECMVAMGKGNRKKYRVLVYAWLCKKFRKGSVYNK